MIKLIGKKGCSACLMSKKVLMKNKVEFEYADLDDIQECEKEQYIERARECGKASLPFIIKNNQFIDLKEAIQ